MVTKGRCSVIVFVIMMLFVPMSVLSADISQKNNSLLPDVASYIDCENSLDTGNILYVGGSGSNNYSTIRSAIRDAKPGDTVFVYAGVYYENLKIRFPISLIGEYMYATVIDGGWGGTCIEILGNNVHVSNFTLRRSGLNSYYDAALKINGSSNNVVENIYCTNTLYGVWALYSSNNTIRNSVFHARWDGVWLFATEESFVYDNEMFGSGIVLDGYKLEHFQHEIYDNLINDRPVYYYRDMNMVNRTVPVDAGQVILVNCSAFTIEGLKLYDGTDGISLFFSTGNVIRNNVMYGHADCGIRLVRSNFNNIMNNDIYDNAYGIGFFSGGIWIENFQGYCFNNKMVNNNIRDNHYFGLIFFRAYENVISGNNFINNGWKHNESMDTVAHVQFFNSFDNEYSGNYWDDWIGLKYPSLSFMPKIISGRRTMFFLFPWRTMMWFTMDHSPLSKPV